MATKDELRAKITALEPDNEVALDPKANHSMLSKEFREVRGRNDHAPTVAVVKYREEDGNNLSWKFLGKDDGQVIGDVCFGPELPLVGSEVVHGDTTVVVDSHMDGLEIKAADLASRSMFDPRRLYATPNGTLVVFKRMDCSRVVLWSFKTQSEIAIHGRVVMVRTDRRAKPTASRREKKTQKVVAAYLISQNPDMTGKELTEILKDEFPSANISSRHGPHYLSLSRTGRLPEPPDSDPREW